MKNTDTLGFKGRGRLEIYKPFEKRWQKIVSRVLRIIDDNLNGDFIRAYGVLKEDTGWIDNSTMNAALAVFTGLIGNTGAQTAFTYLAVGSSTTAVSASQTALGSEIVASGLQRAAATVSRVTTTQTNDTLQFTKTWTASGSVTIEEIGYFNASSSGVMGGRCLTGTKTLATSEQIISTYQVKIS